MSANGVPNVSLRTARGISIDFDCYAVGAVGKLTKNSTPDNPRYYYQLELAPSPDAEPIYAFCEEAHAGIVAAAIQKAGAAVPVTISATLGRRGSVNVGDVAVSG
jgi:hypothetical protein